jgi:YVTN family beta-propeller protein
MRLRSSHSWACVVLLSSAAGSLPAFAQNAFITNAADNTVSIIDVPSGTVIGAVPVGSAPQGVAVAPNGTTAYVTNLFGPSVSVIDAARFPQVVTATIATPGKFPPGVALSPDGTRAYVTNGLTSAPAVSVINTATNKVIAKVPLKGTPAGVAVTPNGAQVYVPNGTTSGQVAVIATATNKVLRSIPVGQSPDGIAITPNGAKAYVTQALAKGSVTVLNVATGAMTGSITVGSHPVGVAVTPNGAKAYVANNAGNTVSVIETATDKVSATIAVGQGPFGISFTHDGTKAYVANKIDNTVSEIDVANNTVVATIAVGQAPGAFGSSFVGKALPASALLSAVLSGGGAAQIKGTAIYYATMLNTAAAALTDCRILLPTSAPAGMRMIYKTTDPATNEVTSGADPLVSIDGNGSQTFLLTFTEPNPTLDPAQPLLFVCANTTHAPIIAGINDVYLSFTSSKTANIDVVAATASGNGILEIPLHQSGAFAVESKNVGVAGNLTVGADTGSVDLPVAITLCQTVPTTGQCRTAPAATIALHDTAGATPTFSVFVTANGRIALNPGRSRIFVRFLDGNGASHGSTSVAVETN